MILLLTDNSNISKNVEQLKTDSDIIKLEYSIKTIPIKHGLDSFIKTNLTKYKGLGLKHLIIDLSSVLVPLQELISLCNNIRYMNSDISLIFITAFVDDTTLVESCLVENEYTNIVSSTTVESFIPQLKEVILNNISEETQRKLKLFKFENTKVKVGFYGAFNRVGTTTSAFNFCQVLNRLKAKVILVNDSKTDFYTHCRMFNQTIISNGVYDINNITCVDDISLIQDVEQYNFIVYDTDSIDILDSCDLKFVCTDLAPQCTSENLLFIKENYKEDYNVICLLVHQDIYDFYTKLYKNLYMQKHINKLDEDSENKDYFIKQLDKYLSY